MIKELYTQISTKRRDDDKIVAEIREIRNSIREADSYFNEAIDGYDVEAAIYRIKGLEMRYSAALKKARLTSAKNNIRIKREKYGVY